MGQMIRVLVVDPDGDVRHWLCRLLDHTEGFTCIGARASLKDLDLETFALAPELVLVDAASATSVTPTQFRQIKSSFGSAIMVITELEDGPGYERVATRVGADGFLSKARVPERLADIKRRFFTGEGGVSISAGDDRL